MNTIKFSDIKEQTTEQHNLEITDVSNETIFGKEIPIYHPCNLNLFVTNICQNQCDFCINMDYSNNDITDEQYFMALEKTLQELQGKGFEITITGGEPTINPTRFVKTLQLCKQYGFPCRTVSTTGYGLLTRHEGKPLCQYLIENDFVHNINISRMDIDQNKNDFVFGNKNISNADITKLAKFFYANDGEMRISCNLLEGYVDTFDKMLEFLSFYRKNDVKTIMFREIIGQNTQIKLKDIVDFDRRFSYITTLHSIFYQVDIYRYKDMLVKYYITKEIENAPFYSSFSLRNGILQDGFTGKIIKERLI